MRAVSARPHKNLLLLKLEGIDTVDQGDALRGRVLYIAREDVTLPEGRYFVQDLIGLSVVDADSDRVYGTLADVFPTGSNDVYEVKDEAGRSFLVPAIRDVIVRVDVDGGVVESGRSGGFLTMRIDLLTLFPDMCETVMAESIIGRARRKGRFAGVLPPVPRFFRQQAQPRGRYALRRRHGHAPHG